MGLYVHLVCCPLAADHLQVWVASCFCVSLICAALLVPHDFSGVALAFRLCLSSGPVGILNPGVSGFKLARQQLWTTAAPAPKPQCAHLPLRASLSAVALVLLASCGWRSGCVRQLTTLALIHPAAQVGLLTSLFLLALAN